MCGLWSGEDGGLVQYHAVGRARPRRRKMSHMSTSGSAKASRNQEDVRALWICCDEGLLQQKTMGAETANGAPDAQEVRRRARSRRLVGKRPKLRRGEHGKGHTRGYRGHGTRKYNHAGARKRATDEIRGKRRKYKEAKRGARGKKNAGNCGGRPTRRELWERRATPRRPGQSPGAERKRAGTGTQEATGPKGDP